MRILILGSGVIGVTSAWYLRQQGHDVVVIDRATGPAMETSFANAGQVSPGYASPWPAPGIPLNFGTLPRRPAGPAPLLGEHTEQVLSELLGVDAAQYGRLADKGVVRGASPPQPTPSPGGKA